MTRGSPPPSAPPPERERKKVRSETALTSTVIEYPFESIRQHAKTSAADHGDGEKRTMGAEELYLQRQERLNGWAPEPLHVRVFSGLGNLYQLHDHDPPLISSFNCCGDRGHPHP